MIVEVTNMSRVARNKLIAYLSAKDFDITQVTVDTQSLSSDDLIAFCATIGITTKTNP